MISLAALVLVAIVSADRVPLRAAPGDRAAQHALLWQGDSLEVRGSRFDWIQVYDHRRERAGYVRAAQLRTHELDTAHAEELRAIVRFLATTPGAEAQGIGYVAAFLKAAPAAAVDAEVFDALGMMAERLADRASSARGAAADATLAAQVEVAAHYGVVFRSIEREGRVRLCYDGDAFRRVLAQPAPPPTQARAALALTRHDCIDPALRPDERLAHDQWRADVLDRVPAADLPEYRKNRIRLRRAGVWASLAHQSARRGQPSAEAGTRALDALAAVDKNELAPEDAWEYTDAAVRTGASRWAAESAPAPAAGLAIATRPGAPGQTCVTLIDRRGKTPAALIERCTYGVVWLASAAANAQSTALALAVQPLDTWRELWLFHKTVQGWRIDVLPPSTDGPDVGYLEFAGWLPDGKSVLAAREAKLDGRYQRSFELIRLASLKVEKRADAPEALTPFYRWQSPVWRRVTVSLR